MSKVQLIIVGIAVAAFVVLFNLPRGVIKKKEETPVRSENTVVSSLPANTEEMHKPKTTSGDKTSINRLRKAYFSVSDKEKRISFADSLASYFRKLQEFDSSAKYLGEIARIDNSPERLAKAGDAYAEAGALNEQRKEEYAQKSREYYSLILKNNPADLEAKSKLAMTYVGGASTMQGVQLLREVLKDDPKNETAIYNLGILSLQSGQYKKAIDRFKDLIEINPANANAHFYLGMSFLNAGEKQKAKVAFKAAQALEPDPAFQATVATYLKEVDK